MLLWALQPLLCYLMLSPPQMLCWAQHPPAVEKEGIKGNRLKGLQWNMEFRSAKTFPDQIPPRRVLCCNYPLFMFWLPAMHTASCLTANKYVLCFILRSLSAAVRRQPLLCHWSCPELAVVVPSLLQNRSIGRPWFCIIKCALAFPGIRGPPFTYCK